MSRVIGAALLAALIVFGWGYLAWDRLHLYAKAFPSMPSESSVLGTLKSSINKPGAYLFPSEPVPTPNMTIAEIETARKEWQAKRNAGPVGLLLYRPQGAEPMTPMLFAKALGIYFLAALFLASLVAAAKGRSYGDRLGLVLLAILFAMLVTHGFSWVWLHAPDGYTIAMIIDGLVGWILAGVFIAGIVKQPVVSMMMPAGTQVKR